MTQLLAFVAIAWRPLCMIPLGLVGILGIVALLAPRWFRGLATFSGRWVSADKYLQFLDRRVDIDRWFLDRSRAFGAVLLAVVGTLMFIALR